MPQAARPDLRRLFKQLNARCFDNELPLVRLCYTDLTEAFAWGLFWPCDRHINLCKTVPAEEVQGILLHEMVHLKQNYRGKAMHHDRYFRKELARCSTIIGLPT